MRVLLIGDYPGPSGQVTGGVQAAASVLADELAKQPDVELTVLTCQASLQQDEVVHNKAFHVYYMRSSTTAGLFTQYRVNRARLRRAINEIQPDVIHAQNTGFQALAAFDSRLPVVLTVHGIFLRDGDFYFSRGLSGRVRRMLFNRVHQKCLSQAKHIICISPYTWESLKHFTSGEMYPINNPVHPVYFEQTREPVDNRLLFVGVIFPYKGIEYLLEAFNELRESYPGIKLDLVGKVTNEDYYQSLVNYIDRNGLGEAVKFLGSMDRLSIARKYASATVSVLPSVQENAPIVLSESMAVGCPVVATRVGGVASMLEDSVSGYVVEPQNPQELASAISRLLADRELRTQMESHARQAALENFSPAVVASRTVEVYRRMLRAG